MKYLQRKCFFLLLLSVCSGASARCPTNGFKADGSKCTEIADAYCASGQCTNRVEQCKQVGQLFNLPEYNQDCLGFDPFFSFSFSFSLN